MAEFLKQQHKSQRDWLRMMNATAAQAQYAYAFLQWCDAFSLLLCQGQLPPAGRRLEISQGSMLNLILFRDEVMIRYMSIPGRLRWIHLSWASKLSN